MMMTNLANLLVSPDQYEVVATGEADEPLVSKTKRKCSDSLSRRAKGPPKNMLELLSPNPYVGSYLVSRDILYFGIFTVKPMTTMNAPAGKI